MIAYPANPKDMEKMMKCDQRLSRQEKQIERTRARILGRGIFPSNSEESTLLEGGPSE